MSITLKNIRCFRFKPLKIINNFRPNFTSHTEISSSLRMASYLNQKYRNTPFMEINVYVTEDLKYYLSEITTI